MCGNIKPSEMFQIEVSDDGIYHFFIDGRMSTSDDPGDCIDKLMEWLESHEDD